MSLSDRVVILRVYKQGESNLIIHALSQNGSKIKLLAPAALKSKKRFGGGVLQPTHYIQISYKPSKQEGGLSTMLEAKVLESFDHLRENYDYIECALYFLKVMDRVAQEGDEHSGTLFRLLGHSLRAINSSNNLEVLKLHFEIRLLYTQGVLQMDASMESYLKTPITESSKIIKDMHFDKASFIAKHTLSQYL